MMSDVLVNKVANSGLITFDLEPYLPKQHITSFDLKSHLFMELVLKEKDFRASLKTLDWGIYTGKHVAVFCSADAIVPVWAFMLVVSYLQPVAEDVYMGTEEEMKKHLFLANLQRINIQEFKDERVVVKGCGDAAIGSYAYAEITKRLTAVAKSIMYGEPCSTVPIFKRKA